MAVDCPRGSSSKSFLRPARPSILQSSPSSNLSTALLILTHCHASQFVWSFLCFVLCICWSSVCHDLFLLLQLLYPWKPLKHLHTKHYLSCLQVGQASHPPCFLPTVIVTWWCLHVHFFHSLWRLPGSRTVNLSLKATIQSGCNCMDWKSVIYWRWKEELWKATWRRQHFIVM